jgi:signal transduction histidine kinase
MTNAIKHTAGEKRVVFTARESGDSVRFAVFNTGKNIPEDEFAKIWDVFYKVDKSRSRGDGGHGIGLSIVRSVAELHGGRSWAANASGGVVFYIELPRKA